MAPAAPVALEPAAPSVFVSRCRTPVQAPHASATTHAAVTLLVPIAHSLSRKDSAMTSVRGAGIALSSKAFVLLAKEVPASKIWTRCAAVGILLAHRAAGRNM
jgi:hypothetical protein